jgi:hypothetical protein
MKGNLLLLVAMTGPAIAQDDGLLLWGKIDEVFSHPRCANCHVGPDNVPMWSGASYGPKARPHGMNINGGQSRIGAESIACGTCHASPNSALPHGAPGAEEWLLAPVEMQWFRTPSVDICAQIKDPSRNGGRTLAAVAEHVERDRLVHWDGLRDSEESPRPILRPSSLSSSNSGPRQARLAPTVETIL